MFSIPPPFDSSASATWAALFLSRMSHSWANKGREGKGKGKGERVRSFGGRGIRRRNAPCAAACSDAHIVSHLSLSLCPFFFSSARVPFLPLCRASVKLISFAGRLRVALCPRYCSDTSSACFNRQFCMYRSRARCITNGGSSALPPCAESQTGGVSPQSYVRFLLSSFPDPPLSLSFGRATASPR